VKGDITKQISTCGMVDVSWLVEINRVSSMAVIFLP
jgi:hypothetical protein